MLAPALDVVRTGPDTLWVAADSIRLGQILSNLADNARRHTPPGGSIVFDIEVHESTARLTVTDSG